MEKFRERLRELRLEKGLTFATLATEIGFSDSTINYWEIGKRVPSAEAIIALAKYFEISADYLLGLVD